MNSFVHELFSDLNPSEMSLKKGDAVFRQNADVVNMYYVKSGRVKLHRDAIDGSSVILHVAFPGDLLAEASLFSPRYRCTSFADAKTELSCVKKIELLTVLERKPMLVMELLANYSHQICHLRAINELKNIRSAKERVLAFLKNAADVNGEVNLAISLKDTAYFIGLTHESFYRALKVLVASQQISRENGVIFVI
ncbi:MAG: Crp/Fnr family transcriptional regulator [Cellvibrionales bacterium]|nr:MAG: Crp/Fnr family transcriptional regulator [Cellvibrionales bacterium]